MIRIGCIVDIEGKREAYAFDAEGRPLGTFSSRKVAFAAVSARHDDQLARAAR